MKSQVSKKTQIKTITEELLNRLNESYNQGKALPVDDDSLSQVSMRESDTSSVADEKEIHQKLKQILQILNEQKSQEEQIKEQDEEEKADSREYKNRLVQDVFDEASTEELQLYVISANPVEA